MLPDLLADVTPVPDSSLEHLTLPTNFSIILLSSTYQVNTRLNSIMNDFHQGEDVFAAIDMEWPVDLVNGIQGRVALISLTFGKDIFLLPVSPIIIDNYLQMTDINLALILFAE